MTLVNEIQVVQRLTLENIVLKLRSYTYPLNRKGLTVLNFCAHPICS